MNTYTKADITHWTSEQAQLKHNLPELERIKCRFMQACSALRSQRTHFISEEIEPQEKIKNELEAKINILQLPSQISVLEKSLEEQHAKIQELRRNAWAYDERIRPIDKDIREIQAKLITLNGLHRDQDKIQKSITAYQSKISTTQRELIVTRQQLSTSKFRLSELNTPVHSHMHGHTGTLPAELWKFSAIAATESDIRNLISKERQLSEVLDNNSRYLGDATISLASINHTILTTTALHGTVDTLTRSLESKRQERRPLADALERIQNEMQARERRISAEQTQRRGTVSTLTKARQLVGDSAITEGLKELEAASHAVQSSISDLKARLQSFDTQISEKEQSICEVSHLIRTNISRQVEMQRMHYIVSYTEKPDALLKGLATRLKEALEKYDSSQPFKQSIIVRQTLRFLPEAILTICSQPQQQIELLYGAAWYAIAELEEKNEVALRDVLMSAFDGYALDKNETIATYKAYRQELQLTEASIQDAESKQFHKAIDDFQAALKALPANTCQEQRYFYKRGQVLLNAIQRKVREAPSEAADFKYYTKLVCQANRYLSNPMNASEAHAFSALANSNTEEKSSVCKRIAGFVLLFMAAGLLVTTAAMIVVTGGIGLIPAVAVGALGVLAGGLLFNSGCEKGILKQCHKFDAATKVRSYSFWAKPDNVAMPLDADAIKVHTIGGAAGVGAVSIDGEDPGAPRDQGSTRRVDASAPPGNDDSYSSLLAGKTAP